MKKKLRKELIMGFGIFFLAGNTAAFAGDDGEMESLKTQMQQLVYQNQQLTRRIADMEKDLNAMESTQRHEAGEAAPMTEEVLRPQVRQAVEQEIRQQQGEEGWQQKINEYVTFTGLIEGEFVSGEDYEGNDFSEFNIATVELGFDARLSEWAAGHILAKYEGPEDDKVFIDEATISVGNYAKYPLLMTMGKFYMPFGKFETNMIQDPMTLEIGETNDYGLSVGFEANGFHGALYGYNGYNGVGDDSVVEGFGVMAGYRYENDGMTLDAGLSWTGNMAGSDGISDHLDENDVESIEDGVDGLGVHALAACGPFFVTGEYIGALDEFQPGEIDFDGEGAEPRAWNVELAYTTELFGRETVFSAGYQGTGEALALGLPRDRYIGAAGVSLLPGTTFTFEYYHDEDYDEKDGGTDEGADVFSAQLAYEF